MIALLCMYLPKYCQLIHFLSHGALYDIFLNVNYPTNSKFDGLATVSVNSEFSLIRNNAFIKV